MITRRRVLTILAGAAAIPVVGARASVPTSQWNGIALGADAQIILQHENAEELIKLAVHEIDRLEQIFSLYKSDSQLSTLNREGVLLNPAFEFIELLSECSSLFTRTNGAFDPTIQPLWRLYAREISSGRTPSDAKITSTMKMIGWNKVRFSQQKVNFTRANMALTLNGIAQGYIADKVAALLRKNGVKNVLVNTGEIAALGNAPEGKDWSIKLREDGRRISLSNASIATSSPLGTTFDAANTTGHILDPRTGFPASKWSEVSVISNSTAEADGLSTAFCLMNKDEILAAKGRSEVFLK